MHSEIFIVYDASDGHVVEYFHHEVVNFNVVPADDFLPECEVLCHVSAFVIASQQDHFLGEVYLYRKKQNHAVEAEDATIYVISEEQIVDV